MMRYRLPPVAETRLCSPVRWLSGLSVPLVIITIIIMRTRQVDTAVGLILMSFACILSSLALFLSFVGMLDIWEKGKQGFGKLLFAIFLSVLVLALPTYYSVLAFRLPAITDVSTDLDERPVFSQTSLALLKREGYSHPKPHGGADALQRRVYPEMRPIILELPPDKAMALVRDAINALKWRIVLEVPPIAPVNQAQQGQDGYLEALRESPLLRLKTDIVVRIHPTGQNVRIDMRSASRFLSHDFGENAALIHRLQREIIALQN